MKFNRIAIGLVVCAAGLTAAEAQEPAAGPRAAVELRWVESKRVEGLTEAEGFQSSCDPKSIVYPHKKPALALTAKELSEVQLRHHDFSASGLSSENYSVRLHLTKEAREKLSATCEGNEMRLLTIVVDGKYWGLHRYEKDKDKRGVPTAARAETFTPDIGYFSSKTDAERVVNSLR